MARVTVEDCILKIPNRFELVMTAAQRTRDISAGAALSVDRDNDKNPVVSLREIADETVDIDALKDNLIKGLQRYVEADEPEDELDQISDASEDLMAADPNDQEALLADALTIHDGAAEAEAHGQVFLDADVTD